MIDEIGLDEIGNEAGLDELEIGLDEIGIEAGLDELEIGLDEIGTEAGMDELEIPVPRTTEEEPNELDESRMVPELDDCEVLLETVELEFAQMCDVVELEMDVPAFAELMKQRIVMTNKQEGLSNIIEIFE